MQQAKGGSADALGELVQGCRQYLLLVADRGLGGDLQSKAGASDIVQETLMEAHQDFERFEGNTEEQLWAWLGKILHNNLANFQRRFRQTEMRQVAREISLEQNRFANGEEKPLHADTTSPSGRAIRKEEAGRIEQALEGLPEDYRHVVILRHREERSFHEIGRLMNRSPDAARMLWWRAFERLAEELEGQNGQS
jgi:RNA polymerase sigma-70 factor (ECF subfamily)